MTIQLELERDCRCSGMAINCELCHGSGVIVGEDGSELLAFLRRHLKPECFAEAERG